jgi:hypothetical protein
MPWRCDFSQEQGHFSPITGVDSFLCLFNVQAEKACRRSRRGTAGMAPLAS